MKPIRLHSLSFLAGCSLAALAFLTMGHGAARSAPPVEYRIEVDIDQAEVMKLAGEGWEFAGYLGESTRGSSSDETLWKRPVK